MEYRSIQQIHKINLIGILLIAIKMPITIKEQSR